MRGADLDDAVLYGREVFEDAFDWDSNHIEVYISYVKYASYYVSNTSNPYIDLGWNAHGSDEATVLSVLWHELAHAFIDDVYDDLSIKTKTKFEALFGEIEIEPALYDYITYRKHFDESKYVTPYATVSPEEDFAETVSAYLSEDYCVPTPRIIKAKLSFVKRLKTR